MPPSNSVPFHHVEHRVVTGSDELGDAVFRGYFVVHTEQMLARYRRYVAPAAALVDQDALERIGQRWASRPRRLFTPARRWWWPDGWIRPSGIPLPPTSPTPARAAHWPSSTTPATREQPALLGALLTEWLVRVDRAG